MDAYDFLRKYNVNFCDHKVLNKDKNNNVTLDAILKGIKRVTWHEIYFSAFAICCLYRSISALFCPNLYSYLNTF